MIRRGHFREICRSGRYAAVPAYPGNHPQIAGLDTRSDAKRGFPIAVAYEDAVFRAEGLSDDTYGEAKRFFELSDWQLHRFVCSCHSGTTVPSFIPLIGLGPLAVFLAALRHGAPTRPRLAGAVAGLLAGGIAATFYAAHCTDDSPLFVATWYSIAIAGLAALGSVLGRRVARW
ncbi:hypothetical protein J2W42_005504 [Rhizobium tibeticum]|uniref:NrsF family protein n=1 Tax=Rhizobium tibeticum TaxID=501024 RepID=UPI0027866D76|nr:NrsF family protein [Rhizobium tibeticum]MDP9812634.1 hypothetical protein [Rhizobium tibeticum]